MKKISLALAALAAIGTSACYDHVSPHRPGLRDYFDGGSPPDALEEKLDQGSPDQGDRKADSAVEAKPCAGVEIFLNYHSSADGQFFLEMHPQIMENYARLIEEGTISLSYQNLPTHTWAAEAAECARNQGEEVFFRYLTYIFENQTEWFHATSPELFKEYAESLGLDTEAFNRCADGRQTYDIVDAQIAEGYERGIIGTPTIFVNGEFATLGEYSRLFSDLSEIIDSELKECEGQAKQDI